MIFYRGKNNKKWESELHSIIELAKKCCNKKKISLWGNLQVLMSPAFLRPFRCVGILYMIHVMSGFMLVSTYTDTFLEV